MTYTVDFADYGTRRTSPPREPSDRAGLAQLDRLLLGLAAVAVAFAAADTYVVVLALPDMMTGVGVPIDQLQRAAPIVSGFLLGYVAMLPLIGRIADLRGRVPVLVMALVLFALGSLVTTLAYDMPSIVAGRFLQGVGGGGLVPATLALVADLYPAERRGVPLGVVSAVQEVGSVIGPLFGAAGAGLRRLAGDLRDQPRGRAGAGRGDPRPGAWSADAARTAASRTRPDLVGLLLLLATLGGGGSSSCVHPPLLRDLTWGQLFIPFAGDGRWLTPIGVIADRRRSSCCWPGAGSPRGRCSTCAAGSRVLRRGRPRRGAAAGAGPGRRDPGLRDRRPQGRGLLRPAAGGTSWAPRGRGRLRLAPAPGGGTRSCRAARCVVRRRGGRCWSASSSAPR